MSITRCVCRSAVHDSITLSAEEMVTVLSKEEVLSRTAKTGVLGLLQTGQDGSVVVCKQVSVHVLSQLLCISCLHSYGIVLESCSMCSKQIGHSCSVMCDCSMMSVYGCLCNQQDRRQRI